MRYHLCLTVNRLPRGHSSIFQILSNPLANKPVTNMADWKTKSKISITINTNTDNHSNKWNMSTHQVLTQVFKPLGPYFLFQGKVYPWSHLLLRKYRLIATEWKQFLQNSWYTIFLGNFSLHSGFVHISVNLSPWLPPSAYLGGAFWFIGQQ